MLRLLRKGLIPGLRGTRVSGNRATRSVQNSPSSLCAVKNPVPYPRERFMPVSVGRIPAGCGMMYTEDWLDIARDLVGRDEVGRVIAVYYRAVSTSEEACGRMYVQRLRDRHFVPCCPHRSVDNRPGDRGEYRALVPRTVGGALQVRGGALPAAGLNCNYTMRSYGNPVVHGPPTAPRGPGSAGTSSAGPPACRGSWHPGIPGRIPHMPLHRRGRPAGKGCERRGGIG